MKIETDGDFAAKAKEYLGLPEPGKGQKGYSLSTFRGAWPCQHLDFDLLVSRTVRQVISVLSH